jgi:hypothetical protein
MLACGLEISHRVPDAEHRTLVIADVHLSRPLGAVPFAALARVTRLP